MIDVLNSVMIKHDTSFKSLTKRALSQIILKVIYEKHSTGISIKAIRSKIEEYTGVNFNIHDLEESLIHLKNEGKINPKENKYFLKPDVKAVIDINVEESKKLQKNVIIFWFDKSETFLSENGYEKINKWFNQLLINFFKEYRYDWINDLKHKNVSKKRKSMDLDKILEFCFEKTEIISRDNDWLKSQFVNFIESDRKDDNELLWTYGSSMFSATLLTAKNFADDFSIDMFKNSYFILDTNILMTIGLEGHELQYAYKPIELVFKKLNIQPVYFYISKEEYRKAIGKKRKAVLASFDEFGYDVIKETDCGIVKTAIKRHCSKKEDFIRFFDEIENIPTFFCEDIKITLLDFSELNDVIEKGQFDEITQIKINDINFGRTNHYKRKYVLEHDSGLVQGALFLNKTKKSWILTKDGTVRAYANETAVRNEDPIAIGLDSFIQMLAINNGCVEYRSSDFAPLFAKIVQFSLLPEKDLFKAEDLFFILETNIDVQSLRRENIFEIARKVNKLRILNKSDDDITLEIRRYFQKTKIDYESEHTEQEAKKFELEQQAKRTLAQKENLESGLYTSMCENRFSKIRERIRNNWLILIFAFLIIFSIILFIANNYLSDDKLIVLTISILVEFALSFFSAKWLKLKLVFTKKDKESIEKEVLDEIIKIKYVQN